MISEAAVRGTLARVRDPELDEPITDLGFVASVRIDADAVAVRLRLPTYFCAPNFAYLMVADARDSLEALPGVARADIELVDHYAAEEISEGVRHGAGFSGTFGEQADGELDELRLVFRRKSFLARTSALCDQLQSSGVAPGELAAMCLGDVPDTDVARGYLAKRRALGFDTRPDAPLLVDVEGRPVAADEAPRHLRRCRTVRVSIEGNAGFCRGLLQTRYGGDTGEALPAQRAESAGAEPATTRNGEKDESGSTARLRRATEGRGHPRAGSHRSA